MRKTSLVEAKTHLSELVDGAEHHGERILILRHGKPAAAIVPVDVALPMKSAKPMTRKQACAFLDDLATRGEANFEAVRDLLEGRR
jgi:prevent-host-death family protein